MFSTPLKPFSEGPTEPPSKRRRVDSRSGSGGWRGGSLFRNRVTGIVGRRKISDNPAASVVGEGIGDQKRVQKKIDEYFGWARGGIDEELTGILEGVMGGVEVGADVDGYNDQRETELHQESRREIERTVELLTDVQGIGVEHLAPGGVGSGDGDGVIKDSEVEEEVEKCGSDINHCGGRVSAWLSGSGYKHDDLGSDVTKEGESESEVVALEDKKEERKMPRKAGEDLASMVERLSKSERRERKEQRKRKKEQRKAESEDEESEEDLDLLFGKQKVKRRMEDLADENGLNMKRQLATPESSLVHGTSDLGEGSAKPQPLGAPKIFQASRSQRPTQLFEFGSHCFTPEISDRYTHILNSTIQRYLTNAIYSSASDDGHTANPDSAPLEASYVLGSYWASDEKQRFFNHLATKGRHDLPGISEGVGTKSIVEVRAYLKALEEGLKDVKVYVRRVRAQDRGEQAARGEEEVAQGDEEEVALVRYEDIPAAVEISGELEALMEKHAENLEKEILEDEVRREKEKWGDGKWLVGLDEAEKMDEFWVEKNSKDGNTDETVPLPPPEAELLKTHSLLRLSQAFFMLPKLPPNNSLPAVNGDRGAPAIRLTSLQDLHNLAVSMTQKLVQASIFIAKNRIQSSLLSEKLVPNVRASDVKVAARVMGLGEADKKGFWLAWVRRSGVRVRDRRGREMELDLVERELLSKKGDLKKRRDTQRLGRGEGETNEEICVTSRNEKEAALDEDGDREMGEAPPPDNVVHLLDQYGSEVEGEDGKEIDDDSEDSEHALEDAIHTQTERLDVIADAKAELALWTELLPEHVSPPEEVAKRLQILTNETLAADTDSSSSEDSQRSLSDSETFTSKSSSTSASDASSSDTTPFSTTYIVAKQAKRQKRQRRLLEDWDEDWVDSYPCYAAWVAMFKRPELGVGYGFAGETEGSWSGDDDDFTDASSARKLGEKGRREKGKGKGKVKGRDIENSPLPLQDQQQNDSITPSDPPQPQRHVRGRPRKHPIKLDAQGIPIRYSKSDRPIGRPRLANKQLLDARPKLPPGQWPVGWEGLERRRVPDMRWRPEEEEMEDENAVEGVGEDVEMIGGVGKDVGKESGVMATRVSGRQRREVERMGMVSTVQAVIEAEGR
ncbi:hypothetical protein L211DRAFT_832794 [Terfezia boudieri ATCC MYA-4762]|uniref:Myb-like domain-containing protein n=1 Tax=Terfezia boudieri ATCC MYA-4762 TaxID=1051890 RepID=A0A3N4M1J4_9PEZI|nr:hypothetical protein L211DRAFT_832794 [Terfezia boudieri ATCC MYA-4762]